VILVVGALLVAIGSLIGLRLARAGALPGVTVDGEQLGGLSTGQVRDAIEQLGTRKGRTEVAAVRDDARVDATAADVGYQIDVDETVDAVLYRGRQGNPLTALAEHLRAFGGETPVEPVELVDDTVLQEWAESAADELEVAPREGRLKFTEGEVTRITPRAGALVDTDDLQERVRTAVLGGDGGDVEVVTEPVRPATTKRDLNAAYARAQQALSASITFRRSGHAETLSPADIASTLRTRITDDDRIELVAKPDAVRAAFGAAAIDAFETDPQSARFEISPGGSINLVEGRNGFAYDDKAATDQLLKVSTRDGSREVALAGNVEPADLTNAEAKDLGIKEKVSEFTTNHACCESRVTNIHRIADLVDDVVIEPGETFSLNGYVGERTEEKGFAPGGAIFEGEFVEQIGGGVSQFTTTLYNAAYFGGYEIVEHKTHSYYISRYPVGREATLNFPNVDLKIQNNSPHGMVINTTYTDTSITVSVYGTKWVDVDTEAGPQRNVKSPETIYKENDELPKGKEVVIQEAGASGFDITVTRILKFPDGETKTEDVTTTYLPQPKIIERNT
jgi:vancomycin resistance protein YoaR